MKHLGLSRVGTSLGLHTTPSVFGTAETTVDTSHTVAETESHCAPLPPVYVEPVNHVDVSVRGSVVL